jgi:putative nucleotidyltransferase with HDIG domain
MTAEAKDRSTSLGHIRRVRNLSMLLANATGIINPQDLQAIEFAGLLHDYGKTAIPDHLLNKPGGLTEGEYEVMKTHAPAGADMVARIGFKFPVVPIIRHHHENWDGSGYPDNLQGEAIPLGARVLAVVDCYDALRDHRPYRRALSHDQAMAILRDRRGKMPTPPSSTPSSRSRARSGPISGPTRPRRCRLPSPARPTRCPRRSAATCCPSRLS